MNVMVPERVTGTEMATKQQESDLKERKGRGRKGSSRRTKREGW